MANLRAATRGAVENRIVGILARSLGHARISTSQSQCQPLICEAGMTNAVIKKVLLFILVSFIILISQCHV
jgi:hypothetical protein